MSKLLSRLVRVFPPISFLQLKMDKITTSRHKKIEATVSGWTFVDIIPVYKKQDVSDKANYRPINLLPIISKIFEMVLYSQLETVANKTFSPKLCGFRKRHSSQNALLNLLKNWQKMFRYIWSSRDRINLPQQSIWLSSTWPPHCETCCLWFWLHGVRVNYWLTYRLSLTGKNRFNLFINDLMFFIKETEVCNFAGDTIIYSCSSNYEKERWQLSNDTHIVLNWFRINNMVANSGKFQEVFLGSSINNYNITFIVEKKHIKSTNEVKLLEITIDHKLTFTKHINNLCNTASNRLRALTRIRKLLS